MDERRPPREDETGQEKTLAAPPGRMPAPLAAMAEALRANAEALHRIDASQRKIAETMERTDKAQQVVTSTRALNETFRGLSAIQRGLLDAVVSRKDRRGGGLVVFLALLVVGSLAALGGYLLADHWARRETVPRADLLAARARVLDLARAGKSREAELAALKDRTRGLDAERKRAQAAEERLLGSKARLEERIRTLEQEAEVNRGRLKEFLETKARADLAGQLQQRAILLERENRDLHDRLERSNEERKKLMEYMGGRLLDGRLGDPEKILAEARRQAVIPRAKPPADPGRKEVDLEGTAERGVLRRLNRLFPDDEEAVELIEVGSIEDGFKLHDVVLARYRLGRLVRSLKCKQLVIRADPKLDTLELRLSKGAIINTSRPDEQIPIGEDGHSIFLRRVHLKDWLARNAAFFDLGEEGMLTWKTGPQ